MHTNNNSPQKKLDTLGAYLVTKLSSLNRFIFHFREAAEILSGSNKTSKVLSQLIKQGVVTRLKSSTFGLVPFALGFEREYLGNPYIVARELILGAQKITPEKYYFSHGSAFELHQLVTQPQLIVYVSSPRMLRSTTILGTEFRFVRCKPEDLFGLTEIWVDKSEKVCVSDLERTLIDGLKLPTYCGGLSEVAKGFSIKREAIDPQKLVDYALKLKVGAVIRRLGYLMELYQIGPRIYCDFLQTKLTCTYQLLDPDLPADGRHIAKWRLRLNVPEEELLAIRGT